MMIISLRGTEPRKIISIETCSFAASALLVNTVAFIGQYGYASEHFGWSKPGDVLYAATIESVAVTVAAHAHQSQKNNDSALRTKLASYGLGLVVGVLNYTHYAHHWHPSAKAVSLGLLSALSPWLWSMFSRRVSRDLLMEKGLLEGRAVKLGATRWFWHPIRSFGAMRWATWRGEQNPAVTISSYHTSPVLEPAVITGNQNQDDISKTSNREPEPGNGGNQNQASSGTGGVHSPEPEPSIELEPELEPGSPVGPEPEPGEGQGPEPELSGDPEPGATREPARPEPPKRGRREPARDPAEVARGLASAATEIVRNWYAEHGKRPTAAELAKELTVAKKVACDVLKLIQWTPAQAPVEARPQAPAENLA